MQRAPRIVVLVVLLGGSQACHKAPLARPSPTPVATAVEGERPLSRGDVEAYLAVRGRALQYLESSLDEVAGTANAAGQLEALRASERTAARSLGVDWERFVRVREEVARLVTAQRRQEDAELLVGELNRARSELQSQLDLARDRASREFLQAQLQSLDVQLGKLKDENRLSPLEEQQSALLSAYRAEIAIQQGRQERIERRIRELVKERKDGGESGSSADGGDARGVGQEK